MMTIKKLLIVSLFIAFHARFLHAQSVAKLDAKNGFRSYVFGESLARCHGMALIEDDGTIKYYSKDDEDLNFGSTKALAISYGFYKGRLFKITIQVSGSPECDGMIGLLRNLYGQETTNPTDPSDYIQILGWVGKKVLLYCISGCDANVSVPYTDPINGTWGVLADAKILPQNDAWSPGLFVCIVSNPLDKAWEHEEKSHRARSSAGSGF